MTCSRQFEMNGRLVACIEDGEHDRHTFILPVTQTMDIPESFFVDLEKASSARPQTTTRNPSRKLRKGGNPFRFWHHENPR